MCGPRLLESGWGPGEGETCHAESLGRGQPATRGGHRWRKRDSARAEFSISPETFGVWRSHRQINASESEAEHSPLGPDDSLCSGGPAASLTLIARMPVWPLAP